MVLVFSKHKGVNVCVDQFETTLDRRNIKKGQKTASKPTGNFNYYSCKRTCQRQGKRLLSHLEWQVACEGTQASKCNIHQPHPVLVKRAQKEPWIYKNINCKLGNNAWAKCLNDPSLTDVSKGKGLVPNKRNSCISDGMFVFSISSYFKYSIFKILCSSF